MMSEEATQEARGPLHSDRGVTVIADGVVARITGMAASEIEGVHMGGQTSRSAGNVISSITGSSGTTRGISVEAGQLEAAIDITMGLTYGKNIVETTEAMRRNIRARVESLTGLRVTELNITINDIVFPEDAPPQGYGSVREDQARESQASEEPTRRETPRPEEPARSQTSRRSRRARREPASDETAELNLPRDDTKDRG